MKRRYSRRQRGVALIALLAILTIVGSALLVKQLNGESGAIAAVRKNRNAEVLNRAKQALIGYVAAQAAKAGENRPGAFPCPEALANFNDAANEGTVSYPCTLPIVGRFPWRTLGLDKLVDNSGEPLWYAVSAGWAGANTVINSNSPAQLTVDGVPNAAVALIIAPGPAFTVPATGANCNASNQVRPIAGPPDARNYLECENATWPANSTFATTGPSGAFNDQVLTITVADVMPAIEAAIANRIEREIVPVLRNVYFAPNWGLSGADRIYPFAALFADPNTSSFTGVGPPPLPALPIPPGLLQGLLPLAHSETFPGSGVACTIGAADPRCNPTLVRWNNASPSISYAGAGVTLTSGCSYWGPTDYAVCSGTYTGTATQITVSGPQSNGAMSLRTVNAAATAFLFWFDLTNFGFTFTQPSPSLQLNSDGTLTASITATPPAPAGPAGVMYWIYVPGNATRDHALLDSRTSSLTGWFLRNEWHKVLYYAVAPGYTAASAAPRACSDAGAITCLQVTNLTDPTKQRAVLALAGRSLSTLSQTRPPTTLPLWLDNYLDSAENRNEDSIFVQSPVRRSFNDRFISVNKNP